MLRSALKPRLFGLFGVLVVFVAAFIYAGLWQLDVTQHNDTKAMGNLARRPVVPLDQLIKPQQTFPSDGSLRRIQVTGTYDANNQVYVSGRLLDGKSGYWVVTPLVVQTNDARVPIVRGFVSTPHAPAPTTGSDTVTVDGALAPGEASSSGLSAGDVLTTIDLPTLLVHWGGNIYTAFVFMTAEQPATTVAPIQQFPPPTPASAGLNLLNAGYALQWWAFGVFAIFMWLRLVWDDYDERKEVAITQAASIGLSDNVSCKGNDIIEQNALAEDAQHV